MPLERPQQAAGGDLPDRHRRVEQAAGHQPPAVGGELQARDDDGAAMVAHRLDEPARGDLPHLDDPVLRAGSQDLAVGRDGEGLDRPRAGFVDDRPDQGAGRHVPGLDLRPAPPGREQGPVVAEGDLGGWHVDGVEELSGGGVPQPELVHRRAGGGEDLAVRGVGHPQDRMGEPPERADGLAGGDIPDGDQGVVPARGQGLAVRVEGQDAGARLRDQLADGPAGGDVPEGDGPIPARGRQHPAIGAVGHRRDDVLAGEHPLLGVAEAVEVIPLEAAQVGFARRRTGLREVAQHLRDIGVAPVALGQVERGRVGQVAGAVLAPLGLVPRHDGR